MHSGTGGSNPSYSSVPCYGCFGSKAEGTLGGEVLRGLILTMGCRTRGCSIDGWVMGNQPVLSCAFMDSGAMGMRFILALIDDWFAVKTINDRSEYGCGRIYCWPIMG